jgi:hypothetical protein
MYDIKEAFRMCKIVFEQCGIDKPNSKAFAFNFTKKSVASLNGQISLSKLIKVMEMTSKTDSSQNFVKVSKQAFEQAFMHLNIEPYRLLNKHEARQIV